MSTPESARTLAEDILARAAEDWVSAAEVISLARRSGITDSNDLRDLAMGLVSRLIVTGLLTAGDVSGSTYSRWPGTPAEAVERIIRDWVSRTDPFVLPGEVAWLDTTAAGQRIGEAIWVREDGE